MSDQRAVLVIGAGPAGLYAAKKLASAGHEVALVNRDLRPGGLAEYGIFFNKYRMKAGLRKQYAKILDFENVHYFGGVTVGEEQPVRLADLRALPFDAVVVAVGAQGIKWIDVEGSHAHGVNDAKTLVYHYNGLPPFAQMDLEVGKNLAIVGAGNVAVDIAHWAVHQNVPNITFYVRRGPMQRKYTDKELSHIGGHVDRDALRSEINRLADIIAAVGEDPDEVYEDLTAKLGDDRIEGSESVVRFRFACQPKRVLRDDELHIRGILLDENQLFHRGESVGCVPTGRTVNVWADMMVFAVGDRVDDQFGISTTEWGEYTVVDPQSNEGSGAYMVSDTEGGAAVEGLFVVGWARRASDGLVGKARKDAETGCDAVLEYLERTAPNADPGEAVQALGVMLADRGNPMSWRQFQQVRAAEEAIAEAKGLDDFRYDTDDEMWAQVD